MRPTRLAHHTITRKLLRNQTRHVGFTAAAVLCVAIVFTARPAARQGAGAFEAEFRHDAVGFDGVNAYLLMYLSTFIVPEHLARATARTNGEFPDLRELHMDKEGKFQRMFNAFVRPLLGTEGAELTVVMPPGLLERVKRLEMAGRAFPRREPRLDFLQSCENSGEDPEVVILSTTKAVFVVFRGTDKVACSGDGPDFVWGEWMETDFQFAQVPAVVVDSGWSRDGLRVMRPKTVIGGNVHMGMWNSLDRLREQLVDVIAAFGGRSKPVWLAGHSLGAGQAQLFGAMAKDAGLRVQGIYAFGAPHPGDPTFVKELEKKLGGRSRIQRIDFVNDPVTMVPLRAMHFGRAGVRNQFRDLDTFSTDQPERSVAEVVSTLPVALAEVAGQTVWGSMSLLNMAGSNFCFHHERWYLHALWKQVDASRRSKLPPPLLALPNEGDDACDDSTTVARAYNADLIATGLRTVQWNVESILENIAGTAIAEGTYRLKNVGHNNYLDITWRCYLDNGCRLQVGGIGSSKRNNDFLIKKTLAGYRIQGRKDGVEKSVEVRLEEIANDGGAIQLWSEVPLFENQEWIFMGVSGYPARYVIRNVLSGKVLDVRGSCAAGSDCSVVQSNPQTGSQSQIWKLEPR